MDEDIRPCHEDDRNTRTLRRMGRGHTRCLSAHHCVIGAEGKFAAASAFGFAQRFLSMPPGGTVELMEAEIAGTIVQRLKPYMEREKEPFIRGYNLSAFGSFNALFIYPRDPNRIEEMIGIVRDEVLIYLPDTQAIVQRSSRLNFGFDGGRSINVDLQGPDIYVLSEVATSAMGVISGTFGGEYFDGNERLDMILRGPKWNSPKKLAAIPIATPLADIQSLGNLTEIRRTVGPS